MYLDLGKGRHGQRGRGGVLDGEQVDELFDEAVVEEVGGVLLDGARVDEDGEGLEARLHEQLALVVVGKWVGEADVSVEEDALVLWDVVLLQHTLHDHRRVFVQLKKKREKMIHGWCKMS